ncbi:MAG: hypothetical protein HOK98_06230 [Rhodospirillaceae bacterium]|jgi:hypothetical protein|nr:hypothetical protein [Rhodospirillaceae bacterium]MBT5945048.1 hypothetical protein [Rhodospirillaceae bacterium]MBT6402871.1 hypothetical protein [Rhodospirillaceae bacterium]MBT6535763.1 hypothetical protein [Rhodospirillaceae bacterium]
MNNNAIRRIAGLAPPAVLAHADWSVDARKRWVARAARMTTGGYVALAPEPVSRIDDFFDRLAAGAGPGETVFAGFDFPLGLPETYATAAGIDHFIAALSGFGRGRWSDFYSPAGTPDEISIRRPFYPNKPGGTRHKHLTDGLGVAGIDDLRRVCDHPTDLRFAASPLFWTLGGQQVGKAAISGWRDLIAPARRARNALHIWPFDGNLATLLDRPGIVVAEAYPGEVYSHLRLRIGAPNKSKRNQADRRDDATPLLAWAADNDVELSSALAADIRDGFGPGGDGEDRFDATVGLFGMLNVIFGHRPPGDPRDPVQRNVEGWILGLDPDRLRPRGG